MRSILWIIAVILIIGWLLGLFVWNAGGIIYALLVIAIILIVFNLLRKAT